MDSRTLAQIVNFVNHSAKGVWASGDVIDPKESDQFIPQIRALRKDLEKEAQEQWSSHMWGDFAPPYSHESALYAIEMNNLHENEDKEVVVDAAYIVAYYTAAAAQWYSMQEVGYYNALHPLWDRALDSAESSARDAAIVVAKHIFGIIH